MDEELAAHARTLVADNRYVVLGTADAHGRPWTSPVYFSADEDLRRFVWMSSPDSRHSRNLAERPEMSLAVFDSTVPPYHGRCVYAAGTATVLGLGTLLMSSASRCSRRCSCARSAG